MDKEKYVSPLQARYAGKEMQRLFSEDFKFKTWRRLWIALAKAQRQLGLNIDEEQIAEMEKFADDINYAEAEARERVVRHDVMAHIHAYGLQCPKAAAIIHLGATSCYVGDNTDLIILRDATKLIRSKVVKVIALLADFAEKYKNMPTLGFTHFQPAQLTTVGKRATLWMHDLMLDLEEIEFALNSLKFLGSRGTTGTGASFLELFGGDGDKAKSLEGMIAAEFGFDRVFPVSGQTYSRKIDSRFVNMLGQIAQSCAKFAGDMRLLQHLKEVEEPFEADQIGSSAMAYKRNPMRCERMTALCRYVIADMQNTAMTAANQWLERTLDDSANKRIAVAEAFLAMDAVLNIYINVAGGLVVYPKMIQRRILAELPFMATENIMMDGVKRGGNRQELHEAIRRHSVAAANAVKMQGAENDLLARIAADPLFDTTLEDLTAILAPENYIGMALRQTEDFLARHVLPALDRYKNERQEAKGEDLQV